jgi:hypothetical protein
MLALACGACGGDGFFSYSPGADSGLLRDLGPAYGASDAASESVVLASPAPLSSAVLLDASFQFQALLVQNTPQSLEPSIAIAARPAGQPLSGAFSWKQVGPGRFQLTFLPTALADHTDYVVTVSDPDAAPLKTGVSTGSHPRVIGCVLHADPGASAVYLQITFSEPMNPSSVAAHTVVSSGGTAVAGTLAPLADATSPANTRFRFDVASPHGLGSSVLLTIAGGTSGALAATGVGLDPKSWDSPTDVSGSFAWSVTPTPPLPQETTGVSYTFSPSIN